MQFDAGNFFTCIIAFFFGCKSVFNALGIDNEKRSVKISASRKPFNQFFFKFCLQRLLPSSSGFDHTSKYTNFQLGKSFGNIRHSTSKNIQHRTKNIIQVIFSWSRLLFRLFQVNEVKLFTRRLDSYRSLLPDFNTFLTF